MDEYELLDCLNFYWWQDKLETTEPQCWEYDGCGACFQWTQIEEEKKRGEKLLEELVKLREGVKIAKSNIPNHLSHLTDKITSLCTRFNICSNLKYLYNCEYINMLSPLHYQLHLKLQIHQHQHDGL